MNHAEIVIVGAGPVGLTLGLGLARLGIRSVILDQDDNLSDGSRAICIQRHTLEIFERLGAVEAMMAKGVTWTLGRVFWRQRELFQIRFPGSEEDFPPFINLQQSYTEQFLLDAIDTTSLCRVQWLHKVTALTQNKDAVTVTVETPDGERQITTQYVLAADGARSTVRNLLGISFDGHTYPDRFFITDIRAKLDFPNERWFWFDPVFNPGKSALIHPQPDGVWRIDWQLGSDAEIERRQDKAELDKLICATIGDREYEIEWVTTYVFHERIARRFQSGRVFLVGDAAHLVAPFGARGMNSGIQDAYNLIWKLSLVMRGHASPELLTTYETERLAAAKENLRITDGSMRFITPQTRWRLWQRNLILRGSVWFRWLRSRVNSGRLSTPFAYTDSPLIHREEYLPDWTKRLLSLSLWQAVRRFQQAPRAGQLAPDAIYSNADGSERRLRHLLGNHFTLLYFSDAPKEAALKLSELVPDWNAVFNQNHSPQRRKERKGSAEKRFESQPTASKTLDKVAILCAPSAELCASAVENTFGEALSELSLKVFIVSRQSSDSALWDRDGHIAAKYRAVNGSMYLIRPDGHIAARGFSFPLAQLPTVIAQAIGQGVFK